MGTAGSKRILSIVLALVMAVIVSVPATAGAIQAGGQMPEAGFGKAYQTQSSRVTIPFNPALPLQWSGATELTIEAWVKPSASGGGIIYQVPGFQYLHQVYLALDPDNKVTFGVSMHSWGPWDWLLSPNAIPTDTWTHIAAVKSGATSRIYINGVEVAQMPLSVETKIAQVNYREHYLFSGEGSGDLHATVDELRVYTAAVAPGVIDAWRFRGADHSHPYWANLVNYWAFEEGSGTVLNARAGVSTSLAIAASPTAAALNYSWVPSTVGLEYRTNEETAVSGRLPVYDPDGGPLSAAVSVQAAHGTAVMTDPTTASFTYTPAANFFGTDTFKYTVSDGMLTSTPAVVTVTVLPTPDAPVAGSVAYRAKEGATLTVAAPGVLASSTDADGDTLSAALVTSPAHGTLTLQGNGSFTYVPAPGFSGTDEFTFVAGDGALTSAAARATITVTPKTHGEMVAEYANSLVGRRFKWGARGPKSFDSSGFVRYVYANEGVWLPRTARAQFRYGPRVAFEDLQPGDLVFFYRGGQHVGIYIGDGKMIDCNKPGGGVGVRPVYRKFFVGATRPLSRYPAR